MNHMHSFIQELQPSTITRTSSQHQMRTPGEAQQAFAQTLKAAIDHVNDTQQLSNIKTEALSKGHITDLHDVMITAQKASLTLETTVQIQRKVIDAYNEIMRMQV